MAIIHRLEQLCKKGLTRAAPYLLPLIIVTTTILAFGLGRLSEEASKIEVLQVGERQLVSTPPLSIGGEVVALSGGTVYYAPWCKAAGSIDPSRAEWFKTAEDAQSFGYKPAKGCKGI